jgi:hypothetical protein
MALPGGYSQSQSNTSSTPSAIQTPQSEWGTQLSQMLAALGQYQYNWAQQQFNQGMGVTDQNINNYMKLAGYGAGLAQNLLGRYVNTFEPMMDQYIQQAGSYNSQDRQQFMMGQAESTAAQADKAAMDSAQRQLQSFGVNPNSGRYQDLLLTQRTQDAATRAGAGTQASVNTAAIGRQMTQTAAQMGQNIPGMTVNALQSAYTGVTGSENAELGALNTGVNLTNSAANFENAAANANRLPPVGNNSVGQSTSQSHQLSPPFNAGSQASRSPGNNNSRSNYGQYRPSAANQTTAGQSTFQGANANGGDQAAQGQPSFGGAKGFTQPNAGIINVNDQGSPGNYGQNPDQGAYTSPVEEGGSGQVFDPNQGAFGPNNGSNSSPWAPDPNSGEMQGFSQPDTSGAGSGQYAGQYEQQAGNAASSIQNPGGNYGAGGGGGGNYGGYAEGGVIKHATSGGYVPRSASPSQGRQTDDIPARLNAKEFVIPRDVTEHKGTEFFQNLIKKSRQARLGVSGPPAQPKMKPALRLKPTFTSHYVGG